MTERRAPREFWIDFNYEAADVYDTKPVISQYEARNGSRSADKIIQVREILPNDPRDEQLKIAVEALEFYARSTHIEDCEDDLETVSGEPENWLCDSGGQFNLENGGIARESLAKIRELGVFNECGE